MLSLAMVVFAASLMLSVESNEDGKLTFTNSSFAQSSGSESGGGGGGSSVPTACPSSTIVNLSGQVNDARSCNCTVDYEVVISTNPYSAEIKVAKFRGMENTCSSGSQSEVCNAFACSSTPHY